jgi:hypothetical protein
VSYPILYPLIPQQARAQGGKEQRPEEYVTEEINGGKEKRSRITAEPKQKCSTNNARSSKPEQNPGATGCSLRRRL